MKRMILRLNRAAPRLMLNTRTAFSNQCGNFYTSNVVKIIIVVVLGAFLLAVLTLIFSDAMIPRITREIEVLFG